MKSKNSFKSFKKLEVGKNSYSIYSLAEAEKNGLEGISRLPKSLIIVSDFNLDPLNFAYDKSEFSKWQ